MTDTAWKRIKDLLPRRLARGGRWHSHRTVIEAAARKYRTRADAPHWLRNLEDRIAPILPG
ncbi:hypothetical protein ACFWPU_34910 [Streptomyces sp. NPDC058471]|uniref:hypothetical protein n=1 Tax=Streptomyces sp. NPDC058471 TaxID=3346516 RepID=UPI00365A5319